MWGVCGCMSVCERRGVLCVCGVGGGEESVCVCVGEEREGVGVV